MLDDELRALVSVDPPPGLNGRIRAHVVAGRKPSPRGPLAVLFLPWVGAAAVLFVALAGWFVATKGHGTTSPNRPVPPGSLETRATARSLPAERRDVAITARPGMSDSTASATVARAPQRRSVSRTPEAHPAIQVDDEEARALRALFASSARLPLLEVPTPHSEPIAVQQISIEPIAESVSEGARP
jgi:hypothetical protein